MTKLVIFGNKSTPLVPIKKKIKSHALSLDRSGKTHQGAGMVGAEVRF